MTDSLLLTIAELKELTGHSRRDAQSQALIHMGIEFKRRRDGTIAVLRRHLEEQMGCKKEKVTQSVQPNWEALRRA